MEQSSSSSHDSHLAFTRALKSHQFFSAFIAYFLSLYTVDHCNAQSALYCMTVCALENLFNINIYIPRLTAVTRSNTSENVCGTLSP